MGGGAGVVGDRKAHRVDSAGRFVGVATQVRTGARPGSDLMTPVNSRGAPSIASFWPVMRVAGANGYTSTVTGIGVPSKNVSIMSSGPGPKYRPTDGPTNRIGHCHRSSFRVGPATAERESRGPESSGPSRARSGTLPAGT